MPNGADFYRQQIREYTTLDLTPDQIHQIGLDDVARIQAQMDEIIREVGFKASAGEKVFPAFLHFLRTDPQFYATTPQALLDRAAWISKRVDGEVGKYIGTLPRGRFTIVPVPRRHRAVLDRGSWWRGHLLAQHLQPALAPAVQPAGADPARILARAMPCRAHWPTSRARSRISAARTTSPPMAKAGRCIRKSSARRWASTKPRTRISAA